MQHIDVVFYYLWKKAKHRISCQYRYTNTNCLFNLYINRAHNRYHNTLSGANISIQEDKAVGVVVYKFEKSLTNMTKGFSIPTDLPWHQVDEVYIPINCGGTFHWYLLLLSWKKRLIRVYDSSLNTQKKYYLAR